MRRLAEPRDELTTDRWRFFEQMLVSGVRGQGKETPAQPVVEAFGVAIYQAVLSEGLQRARYLALLTPDLSRDAHDAEPTVPGRVLASQRDQDVEATAEAGFGPGAPRFGIALLSHGV